MARRAWTVKREQRHSLSNLIHHASPDEGDGDPRKPFGVGVDEHLSALDGEVEGREASTQDRVSLLPLHDQSIDASSVLADGTSIVLDHDEEVDERRRSGSHDEEHPSYQPMVFHFFSLSL
jgi:hypothetical protein